MGRQQLDVSVIRASIGCNEAAGNVRPMIYTLAHTSASVSSSIIWYRSRVGDSVIPCGWNGKSSVALAMRQTSVIFSRNSPRPPMFQNTDGISKHRLSPYTSTIYITNITFYLIYPFVGSRPRREIRTDMRTTTV